MYELMYSLRAEICFLSDVSSAMAFVLFLVFHFPLSQFYHCT